MSEPYEVVLTRTADKELKALHPRIRRQAVQRLSDLESQPRPHDSKRLRGSEGDHRVDTGEYRILYRLDDVGRRIEVWRIAHRKDVYRNL